MMRTQDETCIACEQQHPHRTGCRVLPSGRCCGKPVAGRIWGYVVELWERSYCALHLDEMAPDAVDVGMKVERVVLRGMDA